MRSFRNATYRRVLLVVWITGCACWIAWWIWHYATTCSLIGMAGHRAITCRWESAEPGGLAVVARTAPALGVLRDMASKTIGIPACVSIAGFVVWRLVERLRGRTA